MKYFIVYNFQGRILRTGFCQDRMFFMQACDNEFVMEGRANDATQKIEKVGIFGRIVDKSPEEIEAEKQPRLPFEKKPAQITNEQWQSVLGRLASLESD